MCAFIEKYYITHNAHRDFNCMQLAELDKRLQYIILDY